MSHGKDFKIMAPRSKFYQGPFGRICGDLPAWEPEVVGFDPTKSISKDSAIEKELIKFANKHMVEVLEPTKRPSRLADENKDRDPAGDSTIPAGYTYFGQFIDHDITFDPASSLMRQNDPSGLLNHRTPRLDLDNLYGLGPDASPYLYQKDRVKFLIGKTTKVNKLDPNGSTLSYPDLARNSEEVAIIGDPRNDENIIVSQLQLAFLLAHNQLVDIAKTKFPEKANTEIFDMARTTLRWLYQHIVWHDFLSRIIDPQVHSKALVLEKDPVCNWKLGLDEIYDWKQQPFIPVEFSVAAYRFGHSMVRNSYRTNFKHGKTQGENIFIPIFDNSMKDPKEDLRGSRELTFRNTIQWDWFLGMGNTSPDFPQKARKIDTKLANALAFLHEQKLKRAIHEPDEAPRNFLAFRNLMRSYQFSLPSGTTVAKKYCTEILDLDTEPRGDDNIPNDIDALWYYILKEAGEAGGNHLGELGSLIVCATFAGLLKGDPNSYLNINPEWHPSDDPLLEDSNFNQDSGDSWTLASIIRLSGLSVAGSDIEVPPPSKPN